MILILVGPSCSGKTAILDRIVDKYHFERLVTVTTRSAREDETHGRDYIFLSEQEFALRAREGRIILPVEYRGYHYGMPDNYFLPASESSRKLITILLPIGIPIVKQKIEEHGSHHIVLSIYVEPESRDFLRRCYERKTGLPFNASKYEKDNLPITNGKNTCDYVVVNREGRLNEVITEIIKIVNHVEG